MLLCAALLFAACGQDKKSEENATSAWDSPTADVDGVQRMEVRQASDSMRVNRRMYAYTFRFHPVDSLPVVTAADGVQYHDNAVQIKVRQGTKVMFDREFTKRDFAQFVSSEDIKEQCLVGINYNLNKTEDHTALYFIATVGNPSDTGDDTVVEIRLSPAAGTFSLARAVDLETAPLDPDMRIDAPSENF